MSQLQEYVQHIKVQLLRELRFQCDQLAQMSIPNAQNVADRIYEYTSRGKLLRGVFVCFAAESFGTTISQNILSTAGAIELAQTALLIHDDIMDNDDIRRNKPSMHKLYEEDNDIQTAKSLAMCVGDIALFHLFNYLKDKPQLIEMFSRELTKTALGQHFEITKASQNLEVTEEDIFTIINNKTANYTFYLPLLSGLILANASDKDQKLIKEFSYLTGLLFQIKDDDLNYVSESQTGKSSGGDIRENKKTLCRLELLKRCPETKEMFGTEEHVDLVKQLYITSGTKDYIHELLNTYVEDAKVILEQLSILNNKQLWFELLDFLIERQY